MAPVVVDGTRDWPWSRGLAGVRHTAGTALPLWQSCVTAGEDRAEEGPTLHLSLHTATLLASVPPGGAAGVQCPAALVQALTRRPRVTGRTAVTEQGGAIGTVTRSTPAKRPPVLAGADGAVVVAGRPLLSVEPGAPRLWTVSATAWSGRTHAVESSGQIHAHAVVPTRVGLQAALIQVHTGGSVWLVCPVVMETAPTVTVVRPGQVDTVGVVMAVGHALTAFIYVSVTVVSGESRRTEAGVRSHTRASVSAAVFTKRSADGAVAHISRFTGAEVAPHCVRADGLLITAERRGTLVMFCAGVLVHSCVSRDTVTAVAPGDVHTDSVDLTEVSVG